MSSLDISGMNLESNDIPDDDVLTHDGHIVLQKQRGLLSTLLQDAGGLRQCAAMETDPVNAQQPVAWFDGSLPAETEHPFTRPPEHRNLPDR